jgi:hypothetical protein
MTKQKLALVGLSGLALVFLPTLSTVGVTSAPDLRAGETAIIQALPIDSFADHVVMSSIDYEISSTIEAQR